VSNNFIVNFTPTGMIPTKNQTPFVPISSDEIIQDVKDAWDLGITVVHLHIRDEVTQQPCYKKETYAQIIKSIRSFAPDLVICVSTSGRNFGDFQKRADVLQLEGTSKPDMASLTLSSLNFNKQASVNEPFMIMDLARAIERRCF
jgi:3-keto-5-aminohexanoate cleavage enzyme